MLATLLLSVVASAQTVVFDFNSEKWVNDANGHTMELPEGAELEVGGVKMVNHKRPLIRVTNVLKNQHLFVPRGNSIDFVAPDGKQITKVVFEVEQGYFEISADGDKVLPMVNNDENTRMWEGNAPKATFFGLNTPHIRKATLTLVGNGTTGVNDVTRQGTAVYSVFNLNGVKVGTTSIAYQLACISLTGRKWLSKAGYKRFGLRPSVLFFNSVKGKTYAVTQ